MSKKKTSTMEREVVELLMESRLHHQYPLADGWLATAERCLELSKAHIHAELPGSIRHEDLLRATLTKEEQRILLDDKQGTMKKLQQRMPTPMMGTAGTSKKAKEVASQ